MEYTLNQCIATNKLDNFAKNVHNYLTNQTDNNNYPLWPPGFFIVRRSNQKHKKGYKRISSAAHWVMYLILRPLKFASFKKL